MAGELQKRARRRGLWSAVALSLLAHLIVLTAIGVVTPRPSFHDISQQPTLTVQLMPRIARISPHASSSTAAASTRAATASASSPTLHPHIAAPNPTGLATPAPIQASANAEATAGGRIGAGYAPGPLPFEDGHHGVHALLRATVGCSNEEATHLTDEEREACNARFAKEGRKAAPFIAIDPLKRAGYDAALQADADRRDGTTAQAALKALQDERGGTGRAVHNDINVGIHCGMKFGPGATGADFGCGRTPMGPAPSHQP